VRVNRPIVVVDQRTYRKARRSVDMLIASGDLVRAKSGITAMRLWLRYEIHTGPRRRAIRYAADLEQVELTEARVNEALGLVG
jgi:hypothetical protein